MPQVTDKSVARFILWVSLLGRTQRGIASPNLLFSNAAHQPLLLCKSLSCAVSGLVLRERVKILDLPNCNKYSDTKLVQLISVRHNKMADSMLSLLFPACELHLLFAENLINLRDGALLLLRRMLLSCMYRLATVSSFSLHHPSTRRAYNFGHCEDSQFRVQT